MTDSERSAGTIKKRRKMLANHGVVLEKDPEVSSILRNGGTKEPQGFSELLDRRLCECAGRSLQQRRFDAFWVLWNADAQYAQPQCVRSITNKVSVPSIPDESLND